MATVTGYTAARMKEIEDAAIVDAEIIAGELLLQRFDAEIINAGPIYGQTLRDTAANLAAANAVHPAGLVVVATDSVPKSFKLPDGVTAFNALPWFYAKSDPISNDSTAALITAGVATTDTNISALGTVTFTVGSVPWEVELLIGNWAGSVAGDTWFIAIVSNNGVTYYNFISPTTLVAGSKPLGPLRFIAEFSTPGVYTGIKAVYRRTGAGGSTGSINLGLASTLSRLRARAVS